MIYQVFQINYLLQSGGVLHICLVGLLVFFVEKCLIEKCKFQYVTKCCQPSCGTCNACEQ